MAKSRSNPPPHARRELPQFGGFAPGSVYKLDGGLGGGIGVDLYTSPNVDREAMSATAIIATKTIDREFDLILPSGGTYENYIKNPVVLWNHGFGAIDAPVAKCETPDGKLALKASDNEIEATSFFTSTTPESYQTFALIAEGIVRGASIHVMPNFDAVTEQKIGDEYVLVYPEWDMLEWSWVTLGCNPDAVRKLLDRGRIDEEALLPSLAKSLSRFLPARQLQKPGITLPGGTTVSKKIPVSKAKAKAKPEDEEVVVDDELVDDEAVDDADDVDTETEESASGEQPLGAQVLASLHASLSDQLAAMRRAVGPLEQADVKTFVESMATDLEEKLASIEGQHATCYPDASPLKAADDSDAAKSHEVLKSFLAAGQYRPGSLKGQAGRIAVVMKSAKLSTSQRQTLRNVATVLKSYAKQAEAAQVEAAAKEKAAKEAAKQPIVNEAENAALAKTLGEVAVTLKKTQDALASIVS